jgi:hypothetical protein
MLGFSKLAAFKDLGYSLGPHNAYLLDANEFIQAKNLHFGNG